MEIKETFVFHLNDWSFILNKYMLRCTLTKRAKVDPTITLESIIKRSGPGMPTEIRNDTSSELNCLRKDQKKLITLPTRNFIYSFFFN